MKPPNEASTCHKYFIHFKAILQSATIFLACSTYSEPGFVSFRIDSVLCLCFYRYAPMVSCERVEEIGPAQRARVYEYPKEARRPELKP